MSTPTEPRMRRSRLGALIAGQSVSLVADTMIMITVTWTAVEIGGAGAVTALLLCMTVPKAVMLVFGGVVADTFGPRFVLMRTTGGRVALLAAGAVATYHTENLAVLLVIVTIEGVLLGLGGPSFGSILPRIAPGPQLARANSLYAMVTRLAPIAGAPLGAWMAATTDLWTALAVTVVTCSTAYACLAHVTAGMERPAVPAVRVSLLRRSADGFHLLREHTTLRWLFLCAFVIDFSFGWPMSTALPLLADERGWGVYAVGLTVSAFSAGALLTTALGALAAHRIPLSIRLAASAAVLSFGLITMAIAPTTLTLAAAGFVAGLASGLNGPAIITLYQNLAPADRMGAAMATLGLAGIGTTPVSVAAFSTLALTLNNQTVWLICGLLSLAGPILALAVLRQTTRPTLRPAPSEVAAPV